MSSIKAPQQETFYNLLRDPDGRKHQKYYIRKAGPSRASQNLADLNKQDRLLSHRVTNNVLPFRETERDQHFSAKNEKRGKLDVMYEVASAAQKMEPYSTQRSPSLRLFSGRPDVKPKDLRLLDVHVYNVNHDRSSREPHRKNAVFGTEDRLPRLWTATEVSAQSYTPIVSHIAHIGRDPSATMEGPKRSCFEVDTLTSENDYSPNYDFVAERTEGFSMAKMLSRKDAFNPIQRDYGMEFGKREKVIPLHMLRRKKAIANARSEESLNPQKSGRVSKKTTRKPKTWRDEIPSQLSGYLEKADELNAQRNGADRISNDVQYAIVRVKKQPDRVIFRGANKTVADRISMRVRSKWATPTGGFDSAYNLINCISKDLCENREFFTFCNREFGRLFTFFAPDTPCMSEYNAQTFLDGLVALISYIPRHKPVFNARDREKYLNTKYLFRCLSNEDILNKITIMSTLMNELYLPLTLQLKSCSGQPHDLYNIFREFLKKTTEYLEKPFLVFRASITDPRLRSLQATALCAAVEILQEMVMTYRHVDLTAEFISFEQEHDPDYTPSGDDVSVDSDHVKSEREAPSLKLTNWADATKDGYNVQGVTPGCRPEDFEKEASYSGLDDDFTHAKRARRSEPVSLDYDSSNAGEEGFEEYASVFRQENNEIHSTGSKEKSQAENMISAPKRHCNNNEIEVREDVLEQDDENTQTESEEAEVPGGDEVETQPCEEPEMHMCEVAAVSTSETNSIPDKAGNDKASEAQEGALPENSGTNSLGDHEEQGKAHGNDVIGDGDEDLSEHQYLDGPTKKHKATSMFTRVLFNDIQPPAQNGRAQTSGCVGESRSTVRRHSEPDNFKAMSSFMDEHRKKEAHYVPQALVEEKVKTHFEQEQEDLLAQLLSSAKVGEAHDKTSEDIMKAMQIRDAAKGIAKKAVLKAKIRIEDMELEVIREKRRETLKALEISPGEMRTRDEIKEKSSGQNPLLSVVSNPLQWLDEEFRGKFSPSIGANASDLLPEVPAVLSEDGRTEKRSEGPRSSVDYSASNESLGEQMLEELDHMMENGNDVEGNDRLQGLLASAAALTGDIERPAGEFLEKRRMSLRHSSADEGDALPRAPAKLFSISAESRDNKDDIQKMAIALTTGNRHSRHFEDSDAEPKSI